LSDSEAALVARSQRGDRAAFEQLVRSTARLIFARIYLEVGDGHRAEDLVQETYLIAWRSIHQVHDGTGFRPWLLSVAHSAVIDAARRDSRKKRTGVREDAGVLSGLAAAGEGPAEAAEKNESRQKALAALRALPEEYRMPLMLRYISGADYETIGRELGISNGSLRGLLGRGMKMLRERVCA
jgi:RNA polymerase sigma-70 factor (ECF subfamily)